MLTNLIITASEPSIRRACAKFSLEARFAISMKDNSIESPRKSRHFRSPPSESRARGPPEQPHMNPQRMSQTLFNEANAEPVEPNAAFVMVPMVATQNMCTIQSLYQQLYMHALQADRPRRIPELFGVMN